MLLVLNSHHDVVLFTLPECADGTAWQLLVDTNTPDTDHPDAFDIGHQYQVTGRSLLLFVLKTEQKLEAPKLAEGASAVTEPEPV
jgi:glycogen operon protein